MCQSAAVTGDDGSWLLALQMMKHMVMWKNAVTVEKQKIGRTADEDTIIATTGEAKTTMTVCRHPDWKWHLRGKLSDNSGRRVSRPVVTNDDFELVVDALLPSN